jgi:hypothetical protein
VGCFVSILATIEKSASVAGLRSCLALVDQTDIQATYLDDDTFYATNTSPPSTLKTVQDRF